MAKRTTGLIKRGDVWHIDKIYRGKRIRESTGTGDLETAQAILAKRIEQARQSVVFGERPKRTFREAATRYLKEFAHKKSIDRDAFALKSLDSHIGDIPLDEIHDGSFDEYRRQNINFAVETVRRNISVARRILTLCARS